MKNYFLLCHSSNTPRAVETIEEYLMEKKYSVVKLVHPIEGGERLHSSISDKNMSKFIFRHNFNFLNYFGDAVISFRQIKIHRIDVLMTTTSFDAVCALASRFILARKYTIIYYPRDFSESRYANPVLDIIYRGFEKIADRHSDRVISNTKRAESQRFKYGLTKKRSLVVPNGVHLFDETFPPKRIHKDKFIYVGHLTQEHGLYEMLETINPLIKELTVIGYGDDESKIVKLCKAKKINLVFLGKLSRKEALECLKEYNGLGLAPYNAISSWTKYCSPLKISEYIASGIPVVTSNVTEVSELVAAENLGVVYDVLEKDALKTTIDSFDTASFNLKAKKFYSTYNEKILFKKALE